MCSIERNLVANIALVAGVNCADVTVEAALIREHFLADWAWDILLVDVGNNLLLVDVGNLLLVDVGNLLLVDVGNNLLVFVSL